MEESIVIGVMLISCVVLGIAMLRDAEVRATEPGVADTQLEWPVLESDSSRGLAQRQAQGLQPLPVLHRAGDPEDPIEAPRILARQNRSISPDSFDELSDDVFSRYRYFADDLSRLRKELAYSPVRPTMLVMQRQKPAEQQPSTREERAATPIGTVFARKRSLVEKLAEVRNQLPVAESVSMRV